MGYSHRSFRGGCPFFRRMLKDLGHILLKTGVWEAHSNKLTALLQEKKGKDTLEIPNHEKGFQIWKLQYETLFTIFPLVF
jgi:hypothetical protein